MTSDDKSARASSSPSLPYVPSIISLPTPSLVESVAGGAHYSGVNVDPQHRLHQRHGSHGTLEDHTQLKPEHANVLSDLRELYCCRPTVEIFKRSWREDADFEDPLAKCKGYREYGPQWFAMPKLFASSETLSCRVMSSTHSPNRLVFSQSQRYTTRLLKNTKVVNSIVVVDLDENNRIARMVDQWKGEPPPTRYGAHFLRTMNAKVTPWLFWAPKCNWSS